MKEVTPATQIILADIFENSERPDKITISFDGRDITVKYEGLDVQWLQELKDAQFINKEVI